MINAGIPKIGLLGLITDGYKNIFPGIIERQTRYAKEIVESLSPAADIIFSGPGLNKNSIEQIVSEYNNKNVDGILIILLAYSQGAHIVRALQNNKVPIALAVVQPDQEVGDNWDPNQI
jgi:L-arabinose isomerase